MILKYIKNDCWTEDVNHFTFDALANRAPTSNAGHGPREIREAIIAQVNSGLLHNYCFPSEERAQLTQLLASLAPEPLQKVFMLTTGSEATECAIKLSRAHGIQVGGKKKIGIVSFDRGFHGRTLGAQQAGGMAGQKNWIVNEDPAIVQVPFPDGYWTRDTSCCLPIGSCLQDQLPINHTIAKSRTGFPLF